LRSEPEPVPAHVAIVMDGNGRWAGQRKRPRTFGHQAGQKALRRIVEHCGRIGVRYLTVFAFSSENWNRPQKEVNRLMELFLLALEKEALELNENNVRLRFIGDTERFSEELQGRIAESEQLTAGNDGLHFNVAANYGGRWDIANAARRIACDVAAGRLQPEHVSQSLFQRYLSLAEEPDPDLFIRTGGEMRISNFLLWQSAYTEFYFTSVLWPDFGPEHLDGAIESFRARERRFGLTGEQARDRQG
jgi:undecaprenyl diphosphate synthase